MAKHRKDRDSWGECTYISSFQRALTHRSLSPHNAIEARTLPKWMFISGSTVNGLFAFSWQVCIYLHRDVVGWEKNNIFFSILRVWLRASRAEATGHFFLNKKKSVSLITFERCFNKHTGNGLGGSGPLPKGLKYTILALFWSLQGLCGASAIKLCNIASVNLTPILFKALLLT